MEITVAEDQGVTVVKLAGEMDASNSAQARDRLGQVAQGEGLRVAVDMEGLRFLDSSGLATLISFMKAVREAGGEVALARPQSPVRRIFELTRLDQVFEVFADLEEAKRVLTSAASSDV